MENYKCMFNTGSVQIDSFNFKSGDVLLFNR